MGDKSELRGGEKVGGYLPALDGVRAIAVSLVLFGHTVEHDEFQSLCHIGEECTYVGICLFFVLSGYLITRLLIREEDSSGNVSLPYFFMRRGLRLFPALWLYLAVVYLCWSRGWLPDHAWYSFFSSLLYVRNIVGHGHETHHLWSLSIEEQFYLIWPILFVLFARRNGWRLAVAVLVILVVFSWRWYAWIHGLVHYGKLYVRSDFRFDSPMIGCSLALIERLWPRSFLPLNATRWHSDLAFLTGVGGAIGWVAYETHYGQVWGLDSTVLSLLAALAICSQVGMGHGVIRVALTCPPVTFLGRISYGVYLWQQLFLGNLVEPLTVVRRFPVNLVATFATALSSWYFLEKPILSYKNTRYHRRRAQSAAEVYDCQPKSSPAQA
jgi:peptidoglycan/LPS O-acetylase OafA/YrhL